MAALAKTTSTIIGSPWTTCGSALPFTDIVRSGGAIVVCARAGHAAAQNRTPKAASIANRNNVLEVMTFSLLRPAISLNTPKECRATQVR